MNHPRQTLELVGHQYIYQDLLKKHQGGKLPHALLFMGAQGVGKATMAYHLAYNILKGSIVPSARIASDDPLYRRIAAQSHGDLLVIERIPNSEGKLPRDITVENARRVAEFLSKTSLEGGWRVIIIDSIDEMNRQAMNAILKGLEEPPSRCLFILICHQVGRLLPTILSRCQRVLFSPLKPDELSRVVQQQGIKETSAQQVFLLDMAEGSAGRALRLLKLDGGQLYARLQQAVLDLGLCQWEKALELIKDCTPSPKAENSTDNYHLLGEMLGYYLSSNLRALLQGQDLPQMMPLLRKHSLDYWTDVWEKIQNLFREGDRLSLDPFQVMVNAFNLLCPSKPK